MSRGLTMANRPWFATGRWVAVEIHYGPAAGLTVTRFEAPPPRARWPILMPRRWDGTDQAHWAGGAR